MVIEREQVIQRHPYWVMENAEWGRFAYGLVTILSEWITIRSEIDQKRPSFIASTIAPSTLDHLTKNFGLTSDKFADLCVDLRNGKQQLFENIFLAHFSECMNYLLRKYGVQHDDAYDATMDTLLDFRARLITGKIKYGNMRFLFTQMASQNLLRRLKSPNPISLEKFDFAEEDLEFLSEEDFMLLNLAWDRLSKSCQELLQLYFYQGLKLKEVAAELDKNAAAVRKQKERCKDKLITFFREQSVLNE